MKSGDLGAGAAHPSPGGVHVQLFGADAGAAWLMERPIVERDDP